MISLLHEMAAEAGLTDRGAVEEVFSRARVEQRSFLFAFLESGLVDEERFLRILASRLGLPYWEPGLAAEAAESRDLRQAVPADLALRHHVLPAGFLPSPGNQSGSGGGIPRLVTFDPFDLARHAAVSRRLARPLQWEIASRRAVAEGLQALYGVGADTFQEILQTRAAQNFPGGEDDLMIGEETLILDDGVDQEASVVTFVNQILRGALDQRATDIHLEPANDRFRIRYRIDGVLQEVPAPENIKALQASVISRLKIMAKLDIAEKRLPQDGRINLTLDGKSIDVRVATIPSVEGESVSLRLLGQEKFTLERLGMSSRPRRITDRLLAMPNGIVLVTGPTGSGKSTSLYCFLSAINTAERRIVTIEDPVENKLPGVVQIAVKPEIDLTFAKGLRSILRGDPNVVMVGEMRDLETAEIAIRAALTGHLVFSTLHTNDAMGGITRLVDMGVEPFLVASAVRAFIAQRLVRKLCPQCREPKLLDPEYVRDLGFAAEAPVRVYEARGCGACRGTGFRGRLAIYEICLLTEALQELVVQHATMAEIRAQAKRDGFENMRADGWRKVLSGETTVAEVMSVTMNEAGAYQTEEDDMEDVALLAEPMDWDERGFSGSGGTSPIRRNN